MHRMLVAAVVFLSLLALAPPVEAKDPLWQRDAALVDQVVAGIRSGGIGAVGPRAAVLKQALAGAKSLFPGPNVDGEKRYVLTEGPAETAAVMVALGGKTNLIAYDNPYPEAALFLGSYYNETGKFSEALKVLDAGLTLSPLPKLRLGSTVPELLSERGVSLTQMKRFKEALASYDAGLTLSGLDNHMRALFNRGRGFVLVEMGRLDEGVAAYKASLKFEPGNKLALGELAYIANLKAGGATTKGMLTEPAVNQ